MDIRKLSLLLSGKISPYEKYSRLEFFEHLEEIFGYSVDKLDFYWKQAKEFEEEFYYLVLEMLYNKSKKEDGDRIKLDKLIKELNLPFETYDPVKGFDHSHLLEEFDKIIKVKTNKNDGKSQAKGEQFENFLTKLFNDIEGLEVINTGQSEDEQIDLVIKNDINKPFWLNLKSPVIIGEAKNWSSKTNTEVINTLRGKSLGHTNFSRIGIVIAMNGFTKAVSSNLLRDGGTDRIMVAIDGDNIRELLNKELDPIEWLEGEIMKSFV